MGLLRLQPHVLHDGPGVRAGKQNGLPGVIGEVARIVLVDAERTGEVL